VTVLECPEERIPNSSKDYLKKLEKKHFPGERHLSEIRQLTFGGQNAEGYFSADSKSIVMQAAGLERYGTKCDQIYTLPLDRPVDKYTQLQRLSSGLGACTCSYFLPNKDFSIHASTFASVTKENLMDTCPQKKCQTQQAKIDPLLRRLCNTSYTWDLFPDYDIYLVNKYGNVILRLTDTYGEFLVILVIYLL
jgi:hypothetical protein